MESKVTKILFTLMLLSSILVSCETQEVYGTVRSHSTASNKYGDITYYTIVEYNGTLYNKEGMSYYIIPVGGQAKLTFTHLK